MTDKQYPANWQIKDYDPNDHLINLKGKEYLNVQNRLLWFVRDQRALIVSGVATCSYVVRTELVELDREAGFAHFKTTVRDVLGNVAIGYGSETARDFGDYIEKAATKSLGRALLALGYGTAFAPEMDEGERVVDSPVETKQPLRRTPLRDLPQQQVNAAIRDMEQATQRSPRPVAAIHVEPASERQMEEIAKLCKWLQQDMPEVPSAEEAVKILMGLNADWGEELKRRRQASKGVSLQGLPVSGMH